MTNPIIVISRPMKLHDPTTYTYEWGEQAIKMIKSYGFNVVDIKKNEVTYENLSNALKKYQPRLYIHIGHGCPTSLQGQNECILTRKFSLDELLSMPNVREIIQPLLYSSGCSTCMDSSDVCNPLCVNDTNVNLLNGTIVYTIACYSASQLGKCAVKYGADAYIGYKELMLFPVDEVHSQDIFRDIHLLFLRELLEGKSIQEAEDTTNMYEDALISFHKKTKYISLPMLWNKLNRRVLGNREAKIYA